VFAQINEIPIDELPSESTIPILDTPHAVLNRKVNFERKLQLNAGIGFLLDETFYENSYGNFAAQFNINETHGVGVRYMNFLNGISDKATQFNQLNFAYAKGPNVGYGLFYENRFLYGKVSFGKETIMPVTFQYQIHLGQIKYGSRSLPYYGFSYGNSLYVTKNWGLHLTVSGMMRTAIDALSQDIRKDSATHPQESDFSTVTRTGTALDVEAIYLF
jgi:hypothetical protein